MTETSSQQHDQGQSPAGTKHETRGLLQIQEYRIRQISGGTSWLFKG